MSIEKNRLAKVFKLIVLNILIFIGLAIFCFIPVEAYYRIKQSTRHVDESNLFGFWNSAYPDATPEIYSFKPGYYTRFIDTSEESFQVNKYGFREINFDPDRPVDVIFYGDSFTFGHGVKQGKRFSDLVSNKRKNLNIANFAYNAGFTAPHYLLHFRLNRYAPEKIFTFTYLGNDCQSDLNESKLLSYKVGGYPLRIIDANGNITGDRSDYPIFVQFASEHSLFLKKFFTKLYASKYGAYIFSAKSRPNTPNTKSFDNGEEPDACYDVFRYLTELKTQCLLRNPSCTLVNFLIPQDFLVYNDENQANHTRLNKEERARAFQKRLLIKQVMNNCTTLDLNCIDLLPEFINIAFHRFYLARDAHWNNAGHKLVADRVLQELPK